MDDVQTSPGGQDRDARGDTYETAFDPAVESASVAVVEALAAASEIPAVEVRPRLADAVDADAMDALFRSRFDGTPRPGGRVEFALADWRVEVDADDGVVRVDSTE